MTTHLGDFMRGETREHLFNTSSQALAPITLAGSPAVAAYIQGSDTQFTTGLTLTVDRDGITGAHRIAIDMSNQSAWPPGNLFFIVLSAGTVDTISVAGRKLCSLSIEAEWDGRVAQGVAQGVGTQTIRLASGVVGTDNNLVGYDVAIFIGTGAGQRATIISSVAATDTVTVDREWMVALSGTPTYRLYPGTLGATLTEISNAVDSGQVGQDVTTVLAAVDTEIADILAAVDTEVAAIKAKTDNLPSDPADQSAVEAAITAAVTSTVTAVFARAFHATKMSGLTFEQIVGLIASALLSKASGLGTGNPIFRNVGDTADAISASSDSDGNRSAVTLTAGSVA